MLRIRLRRVGKKKAPSYRIVVADSRAPRDGKFVEILGIYDPLTDPVTVNVNSDKVREWVGKGAQPSDTVARLMRNAGVLSSVAPARESKAPVAVAEAPAAEGQAAPAAVAEAPAAESPAPAAVAEASASESTEPAAAPGTAEPS
jgi:small subunit ribosomal protein S16